MICSSWESCMCAVLYYNVYYLCKIHQNTIFVVLCLCRKFKLFLWNFKKSCCHQSCSFWPRYAPNRLTAGASPQTLLGELTALPRTIPGLAGGPPEKGKEKEKVEGNGKGEEGMRGKAGQPQIFRWIDDDDDDDVGSPYVIHLEHNIITKFEGGTTIRLSYMAHFAPWLRPIMNFNWHIYAYASTNSDRPNCRGPNGIVGRPSSRQLTQVTVNSVV